MKYRIKELDPVNDLYYLQQRFLWFFWRSISVGPKDKLESFITRMKQND